MSLNRRGVALRKLVRPYLAYPKNEDDWDCEWNLPLREDAPEEVKKAYKETRQVQEILKKRHMKI